MRNIYFSVRWALVGALLFAALPFALGSTPGGSGYQSWIGFVQIIPGRFLLPLAVATGVVGFVIGGLAGRTIVDGFEATFERVARWVPWWWVH